MTKAISVTIGVSFFLGALPFFILSMNGGIPTLPVEVVDDTLYYLSRSREVSEGYLTTANQYIKEYRDGVTPAFFVGDWFTSLPFIIGFNARNAQIFNQIVWFIILGCISHLFFKSYGISGRVIPLYITFLLLVVYWYEARPTVMQVVYPMCMIFYVTLWYFIRENHIRKYQLYFALAIAGSLYVYTYLAILVFFIGAVLFCVQVVKKDFVKIKYVLISGMGAMILCIPFFIYTLRQVQHPWYTESFERIGVVSTHLVGGGVLYYLSVLFIVYISLRYSRSKDIINQNQYMFLFVSTSGLGLALISNIFTGKEFELSSHIGRFVEMWLVIFICCLGWSVYIRKPEKKVRKIVFSLLLIVSLFVMHNFYNNLDKWMSISSHLSKDRFVSVLEYIDENIPPESIIFASDDIGSYIPLVSSHYVLFHPNAQLYLVSDKEIEERYLLSRIFKKLTLDDIKNDFRKYGGVGNAIHKEKVYNKKILVCNILQGRITGACGKPLTAVQLRGEWYFLDMKERYLSMRQNVVMELSKYGVEYIVVDVVNDAWVIPKDFKSVWTDGSFVVYQVSKY